MFKHVSELVVRVTDLVEAEGRTLRRLLPRLWMGLAFTLIGGGMILLGSLCVVYGVFHGLEHAIGRAWAAVVTGLILLLSAAGFLAVAARLVK